MTDYQKPATDPLIHYSVGDRPILSYVRFSIWAKIFLALKGDFSCGIYHMNPKAIDISVLDELVEYTEDDLRKKFSGVGPVAARKIREIILLRKQGALS